MTQKYAAEKGIRKYNPAWSPSPSNDVPTATAVPFVNQSTALPIASAPAVTQNLGEEEISFVPTTSYDAAVTQYHQEVEPEIYFGGYQGEGDSLDQLNAILSKYEVPAGMLSKLLEVGQFEVAEIIVDDSGSMGRMTDARDPNGRPMNRWWEAKYRISQMIELLAYVPCPSLSVHFLNRNDILTLQREEGELPSAYVQRAEGVLSQAFGQNPSGSTPALEAIRASLDRNPGRRVLRYFMGDGTPNGGKVAIRNIQALIVNRPRPEDNPFTFMSCTDEDEQVEWMKTTEEKAPYCAELDDYLDESREVLRDQGKAFPYSLGLHLVAQIVAAFNPHDLDAMDESVPFTRQTLNGLLGYLSSEEEYRYYFDSFREAQSKLSLLPYQRRFLNLSLPSLYAQFESAALAADIPAVVQYKKEMRMNSSASKQYRGNESRGTGPAKAQQAGAEVECCIIL